MGAWKSYKVMRFNNKMIFGNVYCQKISIHPALCITLGSFLPCCVEQLGLYLSEHTNSHCIEVSTYKYCLSTIFPVHCTFLFVCFR